jgi:hypothetical protein
MSQDFAGAVEDFTAAIRLEPSSADFYHNRGFALRKQVRGRESDARAACMRGWGRGEL